MAIQRFELGGGAELGTQALLQLMGFYGDRARAEEALNRQLVAGELDLTKLGLGTEAGLVEQVARNEAAAEQTDLALRGQQQRLAVQQEERAADRLAADRRARLINEAAQARQRDEQEFQTRHAEASRGFTERLYRMQREDLKADRKAQRDMAVEQGLMDFQKTLIMQMLTNDAARRVGEPLEDLELERADKADQAFERTQAATAASDANVLAFLDKGAEDLDRNIAQATWHRQTPWGTTLETPKRPSREERAQPAPPFSGPVRVAQMAIDLAKDIGTIDTDRPLEAKQRDRFTAEVFNRMIPQGAGGDIGSALLALYRGDAKPLQEGFDEQTRLTAQKTLAKIGQRISGTTLSEQAAKHYGIESPHTIGFLNTIGDRVVPALLAKLDADPAIRAANVQYLERGHQKKVRELRRSGALTVNPNDVLIGQLKAVNRALESKDPAQMRRVYMDALVEAASAGSDTMAEALRKDYYQAEPVAAPLQADRPAALEPNAAARWVLFWADQMERDAIAAEDAIEIPLRPPEPAAALEPMEPSG